MISRGLPPRFQLVAVLGLIFGLGAGCSKKKEVSTTPPAAPVAAETPAPAVAAPDPVAASQPANEPPPPPAVIPESAGDAKAALAAADAAMRARDYERAVANMIAIQQAQLNDQQAQAAHAQMVRLQATLVGAVSAGDPKAIAAAQALRSAHH